MATFKLGKNAVITPPSGIAEENIVDVEVSLSGDELDVTVFGDTENKVQPGLADATIDITCTHHTTSVGEVSTITVGGFVALDVVVVKLDAKATPKGRWEYTVSYAVTVEP